MYQFNTIRLFKNKASGIIIKIVIIIFLYKFLKSSPILTNYIVRFALFISSRLCNISISSINVDVTKNRLYFNPSFLNVFVNIS